LKTKLKKIGKPELQLKNLALNESGSFGRIISHTAYHAGQMAIINKYGSFKIIVA
jgi:hypothetical protein